VNKVSNEEDTRKEMKALDMLQDHLREVLSAIKELRNSIDVWIEGKPDEIESHVKSLQEIESKANTIKWKILNELSQAETMLHREDFMRLVMTIDEIVDYAEGTAYRVGILKAWKPDEKSISFIREMMDKLFQMMMTLRESIFVLTQNSEKSMNIAQNIYDIEREIDNLERNMTKHIYSLNIDHRILLQVLNFIDHLEDMADIAENVTDAIRIIAVARKGIF
jgi:predicted phosphate transport protein (TIGR00153 family)